MSRELPVPNPHDRRLLYERMGSYIADHHVLGLTLDDLCRVFGKSRLEVGKAVDKLLKGGKVATSPSTRRGAGESVYHPANGKAVARAAVATTAPRILYAEDVADVLEKLPPAQADVLRLLLLEGRTPNETADQLSLVASRVHVLYARAAETVRTLTQLSLPALVRAEKLPWREPAVKSAQVAPAVDVDDAVRAVAQSTKRIGMYGTPTETRPTAGPVHAAVEVAHAREAASADAPVAAPVVGNDPTVTISVKGKAVVTGTVDRSQDYEHLAKPAGGIDPKRFSKTPEGLVMLRVSPDAPEPTMPPAAEPEPGPTADTTTPRSTKTTGTGRASSIPMSQRGPYLRSLIVDAMQGAARPLSIRDVVRDVIRRDGERNGVTHNETSLEVMVRAHMRELLAIGAVVGDRSPRHPGTLWSLKSKSALKDTPVPALVAMPPPPHRPDRLAGLRSVIVDFLKANPCSDRVEIAAHLAENGDVTSTPHDIGMALRSLVERGQVRRTKDSAKPPRRDAHRTRIQQYDATSEVASVAHDLPERITKWVKANPGCTSEDIANAVGATPERVRSVIYSSKNLRPLRVQGTQVRGVGLRYAVPEKHDEVRRRFVTAKEAVEPPPTTDATAPVPEPITTPAPVGAWRVASSGIATHRLYSVDGEVLAYIWSLGWVCSDGNGPEKGTDGMRKAEERLHKAGRKYEVAVEPTDADYNDSPRDTLDEARAAADVRLLAKGVDVDEPVVIVRLGLRTEPTEAHEPTANDHRLALLTTLRDARRLLRTAAEQADAMAESTQDAELRGRSHLLAADLDEQLADLHRMAQELVEPIHETVPVK